MPCPARRPSYRQPQLHKRKILSHIAASSRLLLVRSPRSSPSLTWSGSSSRLTMELVHCRRFQEALWCLQALISEIPGPLVRVFRVTASWAPRVLPHLRALGFFADVLFESVKPMAWYATPLTKHDLRKFRASVGSSKHNTRQARNNREQTDKKSRRRGEITEKIKEKAEAADTDLKQSKEKPLRRQQPKQKRN